MKQLFVTDLDHTFLHSSQTVTPFSKQVWNETAQNNLLGVATARSYNKTKEFLDGLHLNAPLIVMDGAMIVTEDKELIDLKTLDKILSSAIIEEGKRFNIEPFVLSIHDTATLEETFAIPPKMNRYQSYLMETSYKHDPRIHQTSKSEGANDTLKIVYMAEESILRPLTQHIQQQFANLVEIKLAPEKYMGCYFLTILHPLGDKANALKKVCDYLDVSLSDTTVFGDSLNDREMFKIAGKSIAVSNALDEIKAEASHILPHSNDEDAVARYLQRLKHSGDTLPHTDS